MTHARQQDAWNHTASALAMLANVNRDPKKGRAFKPADFHPMPPAPQTQTARRAQSSPPPIENIRVLKTVFVDNAPLRR